MHTSISNTLFTEQFLSYCQHQRHLSTNTIRSYGFDLQLFVEYLKGLDPPVTDRGQVDRHILQGYVAYLSDQHAVKTVKRKIACIRSLFNYLEEEELLVTENPFYRFKLKIKEGFHLPNVMTLQELDSILQVAYENLPQQCVEKSRARKKPLPIASNEFLSLRDLTILEILFAGGLRVSELCVLQFQDLNVMSALGKESEGNSVNYRLMIHGKGNKERTIYLENPEVKNTLAVYLDLRKMVAKESPYLFLTKFGDPLSTQAVRNLVTKYAGMAGLGKSITPHVFRHSFASLLHEEGVDIKFIQDFLGHSSITTTEIYLHTSSTKKRQIMATMHPRSKLVVHQHPKGGLE